MLFFYEKNEHAIVASILGIICCNVDSRCTFIGHYLYYWQDIVIRFYNFIVLTENVC
jgi:hypothetical protein